MIHWSDRKEILKLLVYILSNYLEHLGLQIIGNVFEKEQKCIFTLELVMESRGPYAYYILKQA